MASYVDLGFEALFASIRSSQTAKRFKLLRFATTEDLARTFRPERTEFPEQEELLGSESDVLSKHE
tara:strand:+ start:268 stop:465 length:198 start_codon:yes stop_codon:yes gene_type:complete